MTIYDDVKRLTYSGNFICKFILRNVTVIYDLLLFIHSKSNIYALGKYCLVFVCETLCNVSELLQRTFY